MQTHLLSLHFFVQFATNAGNLQHLIYQNEYFITFAEGYRESLRYMI